MFYQEDYQKYQDVQNLADLAYENDFDGADELQKEADILWTIYSQKAGLDNNEY